VSVYGCGCAHSSAAAFRGKKRVCIWGKIRTWLQHVHISSFARLGCFTTFFFFFRDRPRTQKSACLCLPSAGIKGVRHHARLALLLLIHYEFLSFFIIALFFILRYNYIICYGFLSGNLLKLHSSFVKEKITLSYILHPLVTISRGRRCVSHSELDYSLTFSANHQHATYDHLANTLIGKPTLSIMGSFINSVS
jgi:hypothetical protein